MLHIVYQLGIVAMTSTARQMTIGQLYKESGLVYIRFYAEIEEKANGQKKD